MLNIIDYRDVDQLLQRIKRAKRKPLKPGVEMHEFAIISTAPPGSNKLIQIITGTVPSDFDFTEASKPMFKHRKTK